MSDIFYSKKRALYFLVKSREKHRSCHCLWPHFFCSYATFLFFYIAFQCRAEKSFAATRCLLQSKLFFFMFNIGTKKISCSKSHKREDVAPRTPTLMWDTLQPRPLLFTVLLPTCLYSSLSAAVWLQPEFLFRLFTADAGRSGGISQRGGNGSCHSYKREGGLPSGCCFPLNYCQVFSAERWLVCPWLSVRLAKDPEFQCGRSFAERARRH